MASESHASEPTARTPMTNSYLARDHRECCLATLLRQVVQQRRALNISHRRLFTERRRSRNARHVSIDSRILAPSSKLPATVLEASVSSDDSDLPTAPQRSCVDATTSINHTFEEEQPKRTISVSAQSPVPVINFADKCGLADARPRSGLRSGESDTRRTSSVQRTVAASPLRLELRDRPISASFGWRRCRPRTSVSYICQPSPPHAPIRVSPQLLKKQREDRVKAIEKQRRTMELYSKVCEWQKAAEGKCQQSVLDVGSTIRWSSSKRGSLRLG